MEGANLSRESGAENANRISEPGCAGNALSQLLQFNSIQFKFSSGVMHAVPGGGPHREDEGHQDGAPYHFGWPSPRTVVS